MSKSEDLDSSKSVPKFEELESSKSVSKSEELDSTKPVPKSANLGARRLVYKNVRKAWEQQGVEWCAWRSLPRSGRGGVR